MHLIHGAKHSYNKRSQTCAIWYIDLPFYLSLQLQQQMCNVSSMMIIVLSFAEPRVVALLLLCAKYCDMNA